MPNDTPAPNVAPSPLVQALPMLLGSGVGATYGAIQAPGKSRLRGALIGGLGGAGAGAALSGMNAFFRSPHAQFIDNSAVRSALVLGGAGAGLGGGLQLGRRAADGLDLGDQDDSVANDLEEIDPMRKGYKMLPQALQEYVVKRAAGPATPAPPNRMPFPDTRPVPSWESLARQSVGLLHSGETYAGKTPPLDLRHTLRRDVDTRALLEGIPLAPAARPAAAPAAARMPFPDTRPVMPWSNIAQQATGLLHSRETYPGPAQPPVDLRHTLRRELDTRSLLEGAVPKPPAPVPPPSAPHPGVDTKMLKASSFIDRLSQVDPQTVGNVAAAGLTALPFAYGAMTAPPGRRLHGGSSAAAQVGGSLSGGFGGGVLGALAGGAGGAGLAQLAAPGNAAAAALGTVGGASLGGAAGLVGGEALGRYLSKEMSPGPVQLGLNARWPGESVGQETANKDQLIGHFLEHIANDSDEVAPELRDHMDDALVRRGGEKVAKLKVKVTKPWTMKIQAGKSSISSSPKSKLVNPVICSEEAKPIAKALEKVAVAQFLDRLLA